MCFWFTIIFLVILLFATPPIYPYSRGWGYYPTGGIAIVLILLFILWWLAWLPAWYFPR